MSVNDWLSFLLLVLIGGVASGINSVAGGGSLLSFPALTLGFGFPSLEANATNSVGLWPGSLSGAWGFRNVLDATKGYLKLLVIPTLLGSLFGSWLLTVTDKRLFEMAVPILLLTATTLLWFQPKVKKLLLGKRPHVSPTSAIFMQTLVAIYGGYFGAGMGIMMLAAFALFMDASIHEINAVKNILGVVINLTASVLFLTKGIVYVGPAIALTIGSLIGGYYAAKWSQLVQPEKLRIWIAAFGLIMATHFAYKVWFAG